MELTPKQLERVKKTIEVVEKGNLAISKQIFELEEYVDSKIDEVKTQVAIIPEIVKSLKGKDGVDGKDGEKGDKGDKPIAGIDYPLPKDGKDGKDGKNGINGKTPSANELVSLIKPLIPAPIPGIDGVNGKDGKDGSPDTAEDIIVKINSLDTEDDEFKIDARHIKNLPKASVQRVPVGTGSQPVKAGTGISISYDGNGAPVINVTAVSVGYQRPTGTVDGSNKIFVFAVAPNAICSDGVIIEKSQIDGTVNWTGTTTITMAIAPNFNIFSIA
jgi:hypothetical protein